jgi:hypothetical protein
MAQLYTWLRCNPLISFEKLRMRFDKLKMRFGKLRMRFDKLRMRFDKLGMWVLSKILLMILF